jgi:long-chain fatty acid transport protein
MKHILFLCFSPLFCSIAFGVGFRLPNQDPEAIARGNAFTATANNPSAIYYNPAGITQLEGQQLSIGLYAISAGVDYRSALGTAESDSGFQLVPQIYYVNSPKDSPFSYGVGLYAPFGLGIDYGRNTPFSTVAIDGKLAYGTLNPVVAYQVNPRLSIAGGLTLNYSDISIKRAVVGGATDFFEFEGNDISLGYNLGLLWQPVDEWSFGLNYRSSSKMGYHGESTLFLPGVTPSPIEASTTANLNFPANIVLGASFRPTPDWNFEVGVDWTDWDSVDDTILRGIASGGDALFPFRYESGFMYQLGVTRYLDEGYFLSAGYIYSDNSVPDETFTPLNPDSNLHLWSVGVGQRGEASSWALSYTMAYNGGRDVSGNLAPVVDGHYETLNHAVNVSYRFSF